MFTFRFLVNLAITFGFFGFWHVVLYALGWSERPFMPNRRYKVDKVLHNMWYTLLGVVQGSNSIDICNLHLIDFRVQIKNKFGPQVVRK